MNNKLLWFRQDLRITDNTALAVAAEDPSACLYGLFIATPGQWHQHDMAAVRENFIRQHVSALRDSLSKINIPLLYIEVDNFLAIPDVFNNLIEKYGFCDIYANHEYGWNEKQRDTAVHNSLAARNCHFHRFHDQPMLAPGLITKTGKPYSVFTPFKKNWMEKWRRLRPLLRRTPTLRVLPPTIPSEVMTESASWPETSAWEIGEVAAIRKLNEFCRERIEDYKSQRDIPALDSTSYLSPWLAAGVISPRQCLEAALEANKGRLSGGQEGIDTWISELIWRDFYIHILDSFPQVSKNRAFKIKTEKIRWRDSDEDFNAWCEGRTGIPIVDAAMRQLRQKGWMHNRLRMIVAMFLSKQLLIDWRRGERYFMQHLIDGHLASNNGGWQWAASTGTDAVPYFRIFNPVTQSQRFDPNGDFIKQYIPELAAISGKDIHLPKPSVRAAFAPDYPTPIVDLKLGRERALSTFAAL
ncbi:MAG: deoxyribodipyrimidine photo-lyase [Flavobacterium sp.]|jgi:deoxyribodipyrimidine photo-lyase